MSGSAGRLVGNNNVRKPGLLPKAAMVALNDPRKRVVQWSPHERSRTKVELDVEVPEELTAVHS